MFKAPAVALNATGFLKKLQTKKEQSLGKEFQVFSFKICLLFLGKEQSKRSNILYADKLFNSFMDILQIAQRKEIVLWF